jgi:hypothetical protein
MLSSEDMGIEWTAYPQYDLFFRVYGDCEDEPAVCMQPSPPSPSLPSTTPDDTVGGDVYPVDKTGIIAPWIALAVVIIAGGILLIRRRVHSVK